MQIISTIISAIAENGVQATMLGIGAAVIGPPVVKRIVSLTREFWGPKITKLRRVVAESVAPKDPTPPVGSPDEEVVHLHERV
ncbi:hypothetical protein OG723_35805 [Streptomyces sp. NBC_01278]|uniref:hypothetical protein n=1 Tax=Streptomyces sp. NBC_01278 TaxID=2903809 RepID=UPI002E35F40F|nr:hypothetical protein [Streptomyces sp. NBC_01278]